MENNYFLIKNLLIEEELKQNKIKIKDKGKYL